MKNTNLCTLFCSKNQDTLYFFYNPDGLALYVLHHFFMSQMFSEYFGSFYIIEKNTAICTPSKFKIQDPLRKYFTEVFIQSDKLKKRLCTNKQTINKLINNSK